MEYSIRQLSQLAGVSARTLRYYDEIGLLKPLYVNEAGYRFYGENQLNLLQQILFYRERGLALQQIAEILYQEQFDIVAALEDHLHDLEKRQQQTTRLICVVKKTIAAMKGVYEMQDAEKFEGFKQQLVEEYEQLYGAEARKNYGNAQVDNTQQKLLNMTECDYERFQNLGKEILRQLEQAVQAGISVDSERARQIVMLHKEWLGMTWKQYTEEAHRAVAELYIADVRFQQYYDRRVSGCAALLEQAVRYWTK